MMDSASALKAGDELIAELRGEGKFRKDGGPAPTMGMLKKPSYTHLAMIELIIENPGMSQRQLAAHFGYTESWISNILAADSFQSLMAERREQIVDPELKASIEERFRALVIQSVKRLQEHLAQPQINPQVALRAAELGAKALGVGGHAPAPPAPNQDRLERLAERLVGLQSNVRERIINAQDGVSVEVLPQAASGQR